MDRGPYLAEHEPRFPSSGRRRASSGGASTYVFMTQWTYRRGRRPRIPGLIIRYHNARTLDEKNAALQDLLGHADTHSQLIDEVIKYPGPTTATSPSHPPSQPPPATTNRPPHPLNAAAAALTSASSNPEPRPGLGPVQNCSTGSSGPADAGPRVRAKPFRPARTPTKHRASAQSQGHRSLRCREDPFAIRSRARGLR